MKGNRALMKWTLSCSAWKEGDWYVSRCEELEVASQGRTLEESFDNLHEALQLLLETYTIEDFVKRVARFNPELFAEGHEKPKIRSTLVGKEEDQALYELELEYA